MNVSDFNWLLRHDSNNMVACINCLTALKVFYWMENGFNRVSDHAFWLHCGFFCLYSPLCLFSSTFSQGLKKLCGLVSIKVTCMWFPANFQRIIALWQDKNLTSPVKCFTVYVRNMNLIIWFTEARFLFFCEWYE